MFTRPNDLFDSEVVDVLGVAWGLRVGEIEYVPLGFGSHHWRVFADGEQWFVTVDDLKAKKRHQAEPVDEPLRRLSAALSTAWSLHQAGMEFVVAPHRTSGGGILATVRNRFAAALYPHVDGTSHLPGPYPTRADRLAVLNVIAELHAATELIRAPALVDDLAISGRDQLVAALTDLNEPWVNGPFGEPARALLGLHAEVVRGVVEHYDGLAATVTSQPERMVLTHGEPHRANTITTLSGVMLIDWDTALIAPPERDLWMLAAEDRSILGEYEARTNVIPSDDVLHLYRLWWDLTEISIYIGDFRRPHRETEDTRLAWTSLKRYLDPTRWRGVL